MPFSEFLEINPKVALKKGFEYPFVEMDIVTPGRRYISSSILGWGTVYTQRPLDKIAGIRYITSLRPEDALQ